MGNTHTYPRRFYHRQDHKKDVRNLLRKKYVDDTRPAFAKLTKEQMNASIERLVAPCAK